MEIGEQLAWLGSAWRASVDRAVLTHTRPVFRVDKAKSTNRSDETEIAFEQNNVEAHDNLHSCWRGMFHTMNVADGFPIAKRDHNMDGLEIALNVMADIADTPRVNTFAERLVLKGFSPLFVATACTASSIMWHFCSSEDDDRISYVVASENAKSDVCKVADLETARHFVGWVDRSYQQTGASSN